MENARIIIIDDDAGIRQGCRANLEVRNHVIVGEAASVIAATALVESLAAEDIDLAVVDGNLRPDSNDGSDGENITNLIHDRLPGVVVVGNSLDGGVKGADLNMPKGDSWALDAIVTDLPERVQTS